MNMAYAKPHPSTLKNKSNGNDNLEEWNPMEDDYKNRQFNAFAEGPGADLDEDLQPGAIANQNNQSIQTEGRFRLALKFVPKTMTRIALRNLCANYGKVLQVWDTPKTPVRFVTFETITDMTRALEGLKQNQYGIQAEIAKEPRDNKSRTTNYSNSNISLSSDQSQKENKNPRTSFPQPDMSKRVIKGPFSKPPRLVRIENESFVTESDFNNSDLIKVDTKKNFFIKTDMHYQERNQDKIDRGGGKFIYTGRSCYIESNERMEHFKKLSEASDGHYDSKNDFYEKKSTRGDKNELKLRKCAYCAKYANKMCEGCSECYCSIECQTTDWQRHKNHCNGGVIPAVATSALEKADKINENLKNSSNYNNNCPGVAKESSQNISHTMNNTNNDSNSEYELQRNFEKLSINSLNIVDLPKNGGSVLITTASLPKVIYIRSMDSNDDVNYVKILNRVHAFSRDAKPLQKLPKRGDICIADFQGSGLYRALVLNPINQNKIIVIYIDFGNVEEKKLSELREASSELINLKCYAKLVKLKNVPEFIPTQKLKDFLNSYVDNVEIDLKLVYDDNGKDSNDAEVEIFDLTNNICLNKKILEMRKVDEPKDCEVPIFRNDIVHKLLPSDKNVEVIVLDNSLIEIGYISCILIKDMIPLQELTTQLNEYANKTSGVYTPRESELCVVKYDDDEWYRGECLEVVGDENPTILFIDYGNMSPVHISNIRKYPKEFKSYPCCTSYCLIAGLPTNMNEKLANRLKELIPINDTFIIPEVSTEKIDYDTNVIHLPEIIKKLKEENLI